MSIQCRSLTLIALLTTLASAPVALSQQSPDDLRERSSRGLEPVAAAQEPAGSATRNSDRDAGMSAQSFATQAATIGKAEIELGRIALKNSSNADVKKFAQRMVTDHTAVDMKLKDVAAKDNLTLPRSWMPNIGQPTRS